MEALNDQKIQEMLENKQVDAAMIAADKDIHTYTRLFEVLKKEPEISLPFGFAGRVTRIAYASPGGFKSQILAVAVAIAISMISCLALYRFQTELTLRLFSFLFSVKYIIAAVIAGFLIIQYLDQKFVKKRTIV
ncbi:hypothetical protein [Pedobacter metabolipauper]|uniref:Uncharacterized protein n=1 Tax=Pedobacter metabolipauper TaxID=425513 RepID=A0A4R6SXQ5_9SPHI|nr:hypothetical protein [Pedobacter metabolipauper]TDQ09255.1 hypothetical protein ATK78_1409 [Pedobacter metabolipauper]